MGTAYFVVGLLFGTFAGLVVASLIVALPSAFYMASLPYSIMGDVIDYDELKNGSNRSANYSAVILLMIRLQVAIGGTIAFFVLSAMRFNVHAVDPHAVQPAMLVAYFILPGLFLVLAIGCIWPFPIDARRAAVIRKRLEGSRRPS